MPEASRQDLRRQRRVDEILDAAALVFEEKGYAKATMSDIAERALLSRVSLYKYFPDKESILKALIEKKTLELTERLRRAGEGHRSYQDAVRALVAEGVAFQEEDRGFFRAMYSATALPRLLDDDGLKSRKRELVEVIAAVIASGQRSGQVRPGKPERLAEIFLNLLFSVTVRDFFEGGEPEPDDAQVLSELFLHGTATN